MKYIQYAAIGIVVSIVGASLYHKDENTKTDLIAKVPPEKNQTVTAKAEISLQNDIEAIIQSGLKAPDEKLPAYQKPKLLRQAVIAAKTRWFNGKNQNGQQLMLKSENDIALLVARDAEQVKELLKSGGSDFFNFRTEDDITTTDATVDNLQNVFYTYQQTYKGIPVEGRVIVVQTDANDSVSLITGQFESQLNVNLDQLQDANQVTNSVIASLADSSVFTPVIHEKPELRIIIDDTDNQPRAAYRSVVEYNDSQGVNHLEEVFVDAQQASLIKAYTLIHTALSRQVYSNRNSYCIGTPGIPDSFVLPGTYKFGESGPGYSADSEEQQAYDNTGSSYWFYKHMFNRDSYDGKGVRLRNTVHANFMTPQYTCSGNNAQYRPAPYDQMIFGTGDNGPGLSESLDVVGHELTHGVTHNTSGLKYEKETGAINEAVSDIFGAGIEAWTRAGGNKTVNPPDISTNNATWIVCGNCENGLQRYMNNPTQDSRSKDYYPERYTGTDDNGGVHLNSGIMNLAFYLLSEGGSHPRNKTSVAVKAIGIKKALQIYYDANTTLFKTLTDTSNAFGGARNLLAQAAETRYGKCSTEWKSVHQSFQAVGVGGSVPACSGSDGSTPAPAPAPDPAPVPAPVDVNKALSAQAYASSYYRYGYEPLRMNDNKTTTQWRSRQIFSPYQAEYAALNFGKTVSFSNITIDWSGSDYPHYFYIQKLENNYWRTIKTVSKYSQGPTSVNVDGSSSMLRIVMQYGSYYRWFAIKEITVK